MEEIQRLKEEGNANFKGGNFQAAADRYSEALKLDPSDKSLKSALLKNRAAVHLKTSDFAAAERDCTKALELVGNDAKALFRRSQAREGLGSVGEAFKDAKTALYLEPNNKAVLEALQRLSVAAQQKQKEAMTTENRVKQMLSLVFDEGTEPEKRLQGMNNLLVLARESTGAALIWEEGAVEKLLQIISTDEDEDMILGAQRVLDELSKDETRAMTLLKNLGLRGVVRLMNRPGIADAASLVVQRLFNTLASMDRKKDKAPDADLCEKNKVPIVKLIIELEDMLGDPEVNALAREASIDLLIKNLMHMDSGLPRGFSWRFAEERGLWKLLETSCNIPEQTKVPVTPETRQHLAVCLCRLYDDMVFDTKRGIFSEQVTKFVNEMLENKSSESKVGLCACLTTLLEGPFEVGLNVVGNNPAITQMMLDMAASDNFLHQSVSVELIVNTASKRDRCSAIIAQGIPVLKALYESKNDNIRARALVGLCKCASSSGTDVSRKPMAEGSTMKLAQACKKFLISGNRDMDVRRFAAEGLSYLTLDADVKDWLVQDASVIRALVELAKEAGPLCVYGVAQIFVNLTNTYPKPKAEPELEKLAKFAKHHVPEEHPKDAEEFVKQRVTMLVKEGATAACVAISKTESVQSKELLARALSAFTREKEHRGQVVSEGGAKLLVALAMEGTPGGKSFAAKGLARICITMNPEIAFPGQRCYEIVRPMILLLDVEKDAIDNYEALLALTNLASISDSVRKRICKEKAFPKIEEYWFMQDHDELRAAAAELLMNIVHTKEGRDYQLDPKQDRLKLWFLYASDEDERLARAATAALSLLIHENQEACVRITNQVSSWLEVCKELCLREDPEIQYRGMLCIQNMVEGDQDVATKLLQSEVFEILVAISKMDDPKRARAKNIAVTCLKKAEEYEIIKPTDRELYERTEKVTTVPKDF